MAIRVLITRLKTSIVLATEHFSQIGIVAGYIVCFCLGLAIFTAIVASFLRHHPLEPFQRSSGNKGSESLAL